MKQRLLASRCSMNKSSKTKKLKAKQKLNLSLKHLVFPGARCFTLPCNITQRKGFCSLMGAVVQSIITYGGGGLVVDIECHLSNNLPNIVIVGYANRAVDESRERLRGAFANSHLLLPRKRITVNLAPADIPKADSG